MTAPSDPTSRFSDRVQDYVRWRPGYPPTVIQALRDDLGLQPSHVVADVGSGTGILSRLLVDNGNVVYGVEPNREMAAAAEADLGGTGRFHDVDGRAEATSLPDRGVDLVTAGQAFVWNLRKLDSTPFLRDYEAFLHRWSNDYQEVSAQYAKEESLRGLFGEGGWIERRFDSAQHFGLEGLRGRLLSSSYTPKVGDPRREAMLAELPAVFAAHAKGGQVAFEYDTRMFMGRLA